MLMSISRQTAQGLGLVNKIGIQDTPVSIICHAVIRMPFFLDIFIFLLLTPMG